MKTSVKVGEFRNRLSAYLRKVRHGGEVVITDRETPIGKVIPFPSREGDGLFDLSPPVKGFGGLAGLSFPPLPISSDPVDFLLEDRRRS